MLRGNGGNKYWAGRRRYPDTIPGLLQTLKIANISHAFAHHARSLKTSHSLASEDVSAAGSVAQTPRKKNRITSERKAVIAKLLKGNTTKNGILAKIIKRFK